MTEAATVSSLVREPITALIVIIVCCAYTSQISRVRNLEIGTIEADKIRAPSNDREARSRLIGLGGANNGTICRTILYLCIHNEEYVTR